MVAGHGGGEGEGPVVVGFGEAVVGRLKLVGDFDQVRQGVEVGGDVAADAEVADEHVHPVLHRTAAPAAAPPRTAPRDVSGRTILRRTTGRGGGVGGVGHRDDGGVAGVMTVVIGRGVEEAAGFERGADGGSFVHSPLLEDLVPGHVHARGVLEEGVVELFDVSEVSAARRRGGSRGGRRVGLRHWNLSPHRENGGGPNGQGRPGRGSRGCVAGPRRQWADFPGPRVMVVLPGCSIAPTDDETTPRFGGGGPRRTPMSFRDV